MAIWLYNPEVLPAKSRVKIVKFWIRKITKEKMKKFSKFTNNCSSVSTTFISKFNRTYQMISTKLMSILKII